MRPKLFAQIFLVYFTLLGLFILVCWVKYFNDISEMGGGEMADTLYLFGLFIVSVYFFAFALWTFSVHRRSESDPVSAGIALITIFLFAVGPSLFGLLWLYGR